MNEFELIARLIPSLATHDQVVVGPGDDCAVIDLGLPDDFILFKTDAVVAGVHFTNESAPFRVGRKALARPLSDVAAMAGTPVAALITLGLQRNFDAHYVDELYRGMNEIARTTGTAIVGGETTRVERGTILSVSLLGRVRKNGVISRSGTKVGDAIWVTGELGGSIAGRHLDFDPRLEEARWLTQHFDIHAMIDVSDGLGADLQHLLEKNGLGAELLASAIPISREAKLQSRAAGAAKTPLLAALTDGEDFELLFTTPAQEAVRLADAWRKAFPRLKISCIGRILPEAGVKLREKHGLRRFAFAGYDHFA